MTFLDSARWLLAGICWIAALVVVLFNVRRQFYNARRQEGAARRSGIAFLTSIFTLLGAAAAPAAMTWLLLICIPLEIFGLADFSSDKGASKAKYN